MNKKQTNVLNTYQQCIGYFYGALAKVCKKEVEDIDFCLQELLELQLEDYVEEEVLEQRQRALRDVVKNCVGLYAVRTADNAYRELQERNKNRAGVSPDYVEEDL